MPSAPASASAPRRTRARRPARARDVLAVLVYVLLVCVPALGLAGVVPDLRLDGSIAVHERPKLARASWEDESFQPLFAARFESRLGLRGTFALADNTVLYHAFHETKLGAPVKLGGDGVLLNDEDTLFFNRTDLPSAEAFDAFAGRIAHLQARLQKRGAALVPVIIPSKTTIYSDRVEPKWRKPVPSPRPSDVAYANLVRGLRDHGVAFVDARALLTARPEPRAYLYARGARHWSYLASCLATQRIFETYGALTGRVAPSYACDYVARADAPLLHEDYDLLRLMNVWGARPDVDRDPVVFLEPGPAQVVEPVDVLVVGTSFCWNFLKDSQRAGAFGRTHFFYYNRRLFDWPSSAEQTLVPGSPAWRNAALGKQLYILDLFESYPIPPHATELLDQLEAALP
ncbi:MAG: hypothetical protein HOO96_32715 [Polyangiaceae bacterium]|nr:hypothetical protein [Polyangiaceae bacterium]